MQNTKHKQRPKQLQAELSMASQRARPKPNSGKTMDEQTTTKNCISKIYYCMGNETRMPTILWWIFFFSLWHVACGWLYKASVRRKNQIRMNQNSKQQQKNTHPLNITEQGEYTMQSHLGVILSSSTKCMSFNRSLCAIRMDHPMCRSHAK